ncbi:GNAT family N-acetyltransferase [Mycobacterium sp. NPDC051804]|uniref:GNAT family N-acetyltransferase n=1 Tax=Mycobacterium sp. NPDC051804 TaxID=3364295 RepID=UPI0037AF1570
MSRNDVVIRPAVTDDLDAIAQIYAHHVLTGVATFELIPPDEDEWRSRFDAVTDRELPFVTATLEGKIAGYGYCAPWKTRPAYRQTVENSVYLAPGATGLGIGGRVLDTLLTECGRAGVRQIIAVIVDTESAAASLALHRNRRFIDAGRLRAVGFKHGRWLDTLLLQHSIADVTD